MSEFAKTELSYNPEYVLTLIKNNEKGKVKKYISCYFIKLSNIQQVLMWKPDKRSFEMLDDKILVSRYLTCDLVIFENFIIDGNTIVKKWSVREWFFSSENPIYTPCNKIGKEKIFTSSTGEKYVNFFPELLHSRKPKKKITNFSKDIQDKVKFVWNHLNITWCSRKPDQFKYIQLFISHMINGRKMTACINIRSPKGIGKSIFINFLRSSVVGEEVVYQTSDAHILYGNFNAALMYIMLFVLEEAPCGTLGEWKVLDSKLKNYITEPVISIEKKGKDHFKTDNTVSFILFSNKNSVIYTEDERRYFSPDTSAELKGNKEYFTKLAEIMEDKEVGEAFYWNCIQIAEENPKWHEQFDMPLSQENIRNISDNATSILQFIKNEFVLQKIGIDMKLSAFYEKYKFYCNRNQVKYIVAKGEFVSRIKDMGIDYIHQSSKHKNQNWLIKEWKDLYKIFKLKNLIAEWDDFETHAPTPNPDDIEFNEEKITSDDKINLLGINEETNVTQKETKPNHDEWKEIKEMNKQMKLNYKNAIDSLNKIEFIYSSNIFKDYDKLFCWNSEKKDSSRVYNTAEEEIFANYKLEFD